MNNLHITLTKFKNESRLLKEASSILNHDLAHIVYVAALHEEGMALDEVCGNRLFVHRFKLKTSSLPKNIFFKIIKYLEFCLKIFIYYKNNDIKIINIHSLGLLPIGVFLKFYCGAVLVYDAHELETEKLESGGTLKKMGKIVEKLFINKCDLIIVVSESIADWYHMKYNIHRPSVILNAPKIRELARTNHFRNNLNIRDDQTIILYQGGLVEGRGVRLILRAMQAREDDSVVAVFMGYGELEKEIRSIADNSSNIFFHQAVDPSVLLEYTAAADIGIHLIQNTCLNHEYCMPNKLFEYTMAGLPVIVSSLKDMSHFVEVNNIGFVIQDYSDSGINDAINALLKSNIAALKKNAYIAACKYSWEVQEKILINSYRKIGVSNFKSEVH